jgi:nitrogen fixation-related uncharacterized protein
MTIGAIKILAVSLFTFSVICGMFWWAIKAADKWEKEEEQE